MDHPSIDPEPNELFLQHLDECLHTIGSKQTCFIMGDFNYDLIESEDNFKNRFVDTVFDNSFMQARRQRGAGGQCPPPIFVFGPPIFFLLPTVFFWEEKVAVFGRKKR